MKSYFKLELKRAIFSWRTIILTFITIIILAIPYLNETTHPAIDLDSGMGYFIRVYQMSYIGILSPVIIGFIYATSIIKDKESGFLNKLLEVIDIKTYYIVKIAVNSIVNFIIFAVSHILSILHLVIRFGLGNSDSRGTSIGTFANIYFNSKIAYVILVVLFVGISAAAFSIFTLGITTALNKKLTAYIFPAFYIVITSIFFGVSSINSVINFDVTRLFNLNYGAKPLSIIIYDLLLTVFGVLLLYKYGYKRALREEAILLAHN